MAELGDHCARLRAFLPVAGLLQRVGDLGRHVVLVVLGEHLGRAKPPSAAERALRDHALAFAEQVGQHARDRPPAPCLLEVGDAEAHGAVRRRARGCPPRPARRGGRRGRAAASFAAISSGCRRRPACPGTRSARAPRRVPSAEQASSSATRRRRLRVMRAPGRAGGRAPGSRVSSRFSSSCAAPGCARRAARARSTRAAAP